MSFHSRPSRRFPARYPGRCLCGASFQPGASIHWDASVRRATLCPSCETPKLVKGSWHDIDGYMQARFDRHPETGAIAAMIITATDSAWNEWDCYRLEDGVWKPSHGGGALFLTGTLSTETINGWIEKAGLNVSAA